MCLPLLGSMAVTVEAAKKPAPASVKISQTKLTLTAGKTKQLTCKIKPAGANKKVAWSSSNPAVATVSSKGVVKGIKAGTATITVKAAGNKKKAKCKVTVKKAKQKTISATIRFLNYTGKQIDEFYFEDSGAADYGDEYLESRGFQYWSKNKYLDVPLKFKTSASLDIFIRCSDDTEYEATGLSLSKAAAKNTKIELTSSEVVLKVNNKKMESVPFEKQSTDPVETPAVSTEPEAADLIPGNKNYSNIKIDNIKKNGNYLVGFDVSYKTASSIAAAPGRISINTQVFKASYPDNSYGDFTNMGKYAKTHSYKAFPTTPADCGFVTWNAPFAKGGSAYYDGTATFKRSGGGATQKLSVVFPENTVLLNTEKTYYVYLWSNYGGKTYPDAFLYTFTTNKGEFVPEETVPGSTGISDADWDALQSNYAVLVNAYNEVADLYNSEEIKANKDVETLMAQAKSVIEQMGEIKREDMSASQGQELNAAIGDIAEALLKIIESMETNPTL
ncbi:Ig-like domain-containing protein [bacterium D16-51]|nr:Ig-like domain-containing protein [bacterium D16-59]RKI60803.1 Ig-like domain-containing protein [bacterium D16-51]